MVPITLLSLGSRGDVQPMLALAAGLRQAGAPVRAATHAEFAPLVAAHDIDLAPIATSPRQLLDSEEGRR